MKHFAFESKQKTFLLGFIALGAVCLAASYFIDPIGAQNGHTRFWTNLLQNSAFFTLIAFAITFGWAATTTAYAGWNVAFNRIWVAIAMFLPVGLTGIFIVWIGTVLGWHHLYPWADKNLVAHDKILTGKAGFLNAWWYLGAILFGAMWYFFATVLRKYTLAGDNDSNKTDYAWYKNSKVWAAAFLPIAGYTSAAAIWLWLMSLDPHWYSTMYAWYATASAWVSGIAVTILLLIYLKTKGQFSWVTTEHMHDLGKFLFAFTIFWTYLWFSQYMLIWYSNNGEETVYFRSRMGNYPILYYGNLVLNFVLPFLILMRNDTKRKFGTLALCSIIVLFGHWWDYFQMVKIGPYERVLELTHVKNEEHKTDTKVISAVEKKDSPTKGETEKKNEAGVLKGEMTPREPEKKSEITENTEKESAEYAKSSMTYTAMNEKELENINNANYFHYTPDMTAGYGIPGFLELGTMLGFMALFVFVVFSYLEKSPVLAENDPYIEESIHLVS